MTSGFDGLCVVSFESRSADRLGGIVEKLGGRVIRAPAVRELPIPQSPDAASFAEELLAGRFDTVVLPTGRGAAALMTIMEKYHPKAALLDALGRTAVVVRGVRAAAVVRQWRIPSVIMLEEGHTWLAIVAALEDAGGVAGRRIAVQEALDANGQLRGYFASRGRRLRAFAYTRKRCRRTSANCSRRWMR